MQARKALKDELHQNEKADHRRGRYMTQNPGNVQGGTKTGGFPAVHFQKKMELAYYLRHLSVGRSFTLSEERFG